MTWNWFVFYFLEWIKEEERRRRREKKKRTNTKDSIFIKRNVFFDFISIRNQLVLFSPWGRSQHNIACKVSPRREWKERFFEGSIIIRLQSNLVNAFSISLISTLATRDTCRTTMTMFGRKWERDRAKPHLIPCAGWHTYALAASSSHRWHRTYIVDVAVSFSFSFFSRISSELFWICCWVRLLFGWSGIFHHQVYFSFMHAYKKCWEKKKQSFLFCCLKNHTDAHTHAFTKKKESAHRIQPIHTVLLLRLHMTHYYLNWM